LDKGYGTNGGVIGKYLGCMLHHFIARGNFSFDFFFLTIFGLGFYKSLGTIVIHIN
jgi:hypothetical protein